MRWFFLFGLAPIVFAAPTLTVSKTTAGGITSVKPGTSFTYVINWANPSTTENARGAVLKDVLPTQLSWAAADVSFTTSSTYVTNTSYNSASGTMTWAFVDPLPAGTSGQFTLTALFPNGTTPNGTVAVNTATLSQTGGATASSSPVSVTAAASDLLTASKTLNSGGAAGEYLTYTVSASNPNTTGGLNINNVVMTDSLPSGAVFVSATDGGTYNSSANTVVWPSTNMVLGTSVSHTLTVVYPTPTFAANQKVTNNVAVVGLPVGATTSVTHTASQVKTLGDPVSLLSVGKTLVSGGAVNQNTTYAVTAGNSSSTTALTNVVMVDTLPTGTTFVSATDGGTYSSGKITWPTTNLIAGGSLSYSITVVYATPTFAVSGSVTNNVTVTAKPPGTSTTLTNSASLKTTLVDPSTFLTTSKSSSGTGLGDIITYTVKASNSSSSGITITNVVMTDTLPTGTTFVSATGSGVYNSNANTVIWPAISLAPGASTTQTLVVRYPNPPYSVGSSVTNNLRATGGLPGGTSATNSTQKIITLTSSSSALTSGKTLLVGGAAGNNSTYTLSVTNPTVSGVTLTNVVITDVLPVGAVFVSADGNGVYNSATRTVTWPATSLNSGSSVSQRVTLSYPTPTFAAAQKVTNIVNAVGTPPGGSPVPSSATNVVTLAAPTDSTGFVKTSNKTVATTLAGSSPTTISYSIKPSNTGNTVLTNFVVTDILPTGVVVSAWQIDPVNTADSFLTAGTVLLEYSTNATAPFTWKSGIAATNSFTRKTSGLPTNITALRWTYSALPPGFSSPSGTISSSAGSGFQAKLAATFPDASTVQNCASYAYTTTYGTPTQKTGSSCVSLTASNGQTAALVATKYAPNPSAVNPGTTVTYIIGTKAGDTSASIANPVLADLLPTGMTYVDGSWAVVAGPTPTLFEAIPNYGGTGQTLLRWSYTASVGTTEAKLSFQAKVPAAAYAGTSYSNTSYLVNWDNGTVSGNSTTDVNDLNGDGSKTDKIAASTTVVVTVNRAASLNSLKYVIGQLDVDYSRYPTNGNSVPGGVANYKLTVQNSGDVNLTNILIIDILPFVGDKGVIDQSPRNSAWRPYLAGTVSAPSGVTVYYSTQANPSRPEMGVTTTNAANWSTVVPADITTVQSLKFDFGKTVLGPLDQVELNWQMRVPPNAPTDASIAWNSFGVIATPTDTLIPFNPTEPIKVGIAAEPIKPAALGDFVWNDTNQNGIQDVGEAGVDAVRVELYKHTGPQAGADPTQDTYIDFTLTSGGGKYMFSSLPAGDYYTVFFPPPTYLISPASRGSDRTVDSNGTSTTVKGFPAAITPIVTLISGDVNLYVDQGIYKPTTPINAVGNYVWNDINADGIQNEPASSGLNGIAVQVYSSGNTLLGSTTTTNDINGSPGYYLFDGLPNGTYYLKFALPSGDTFTTKNASGSTNSTDSDVFSSGGNQGKTPTFTLTGGQYDTTWDAGLNLPTGSMSIGDYVWIDTNGNGLVDSGENGINGVKLNLYKDSDASGSYTPGVDTFFATTTTFTQAGAPGYYSFTSLPVGAYIVQIDPSNFGSGAILEGMAPSGPQPPPGPDTDIDNDNNGYASTGNGVISAVVTLNSSREPGPDSNNNNGTVDFGFYLPVTIGNFVFVDSNGNGVQDSGEPGISGVTLTLTGTSAGGNSITDRATTDTNGLYSFSEPPGTYTVTVDDSNASASLSGYFATTTGLGTTSTDSNVNPSSTTPATLTSGATDNSIDFGYYKQVSIGNFVWLDSNGNGVQDPTESGIDGVTLTLSGTSSSGAAITDTTTTSAGGSYRFNEPPGTYTVTVDASNLTNALAGYSATATGTGSPSSDSNSNPSSTSPASLTSGASDTTVDFGFYAPVTVGDFVWLDTNGNGIQDSGEPGIQGVTLTLTGTTQAGAPISDSVTTASDGSYRFSEPPGSYIITVDSSNASGSLAGLVPTVSGLGTPATDSNISPSSTVPLTLNTGGSDTTVDFGYFKPVKIGNFVWVDVTGNGIQDIGEPGIPGVTLTLTGTTASGVPVTDYTTTDSSGAYSFTEPPGSYTVSVDASNAVGALLGFAPTAVNKGAPGIDSNLSPSGTTPTALISGGVDNTIDFGYFKPVTIGDFVWVDTNGNGIQDGGEPGINGVTLTLSGTTASGIPVTDHATTSGNGAYSFTEPPGTYTVTVDPTNATGALAGYSPTATGKGSAATDSNGNPSATAPTALLSGAIDGTIDFGYYKPVAIGDFVWVDTNGNGVQDGGEPGINGVTLTLSGTTAAGALITDHATTFGNGSFSFSEPPGTYTVSVDAGNAAGALAGYRPTATGLGTPTTDSNGSPSATTPTTLNSGDTDSTIDFGYYKPVTIGDFVWVDSNGNGVQDIGEPGINGVTLTLSGTSGTGDPITDHATTSGNGAFSFSEPPGTYTVTVDVGNAAGALAGYSSTALGQGTTATDSNGSPSSTTPTTLLSGATDRTIDFGYFKPVTIGDFVWVDTNGNGVQDGGEPGIGGVTLTLSGTSGLGIPITEQATTLGNGAYSFSEPPGTYTVTIDVGNSAGALAGYRPTVTGLGTPTTDSNGSPSPTTPAALASGATDSTIDFGYYKPVAIGDFVWVDSNGNGIQDSGEPGIAGVILTLTGTNAVGVVITNQVTTDSLGFYSFSEAPGTYLVTVDPTNSVNGGALVGYALTASGQGTTDTDSNSNSTGTTPAALDSGATDSSIDFGYYIPVTIGDFVWLDTNRDGVQDPSEAGIVGVTLTLTGTTATGESKTDHATTDAQGHYQFSEPPGTYTVTVDDSNSTAALSGYIPTVTSQGTLDTDSNLDPSGTTPELLISGGSDSTLDFGYIVAPPTAVRVSTFTAQRLSTHSTKIEWRALADSDVVGFLVERHDSAGWVRVTPRIIPLTGNGRTPKVYNLVDAGGASAYHLLAVDRIGNSQVIATAIPTMGTVLRLTDDVGTLNIQLFGTPKADVGIESSVDLESGIWEDAGGLQLDATGAAVFTAPVETGTPKRFYRFTEK